MGTEAESATAWARWVAANSAAPAEVLLRLLDPAGRPAWDVLCGGRALPDEVVAAIVAGPETPQRGLLARNPHATPEQRGRLASDPQGQGAARRGLRAETRDLAAATAAGRCHRDLPHRREQRVGGL